jgi:hypothetical protein
MYPILYSSKILLSMEFILQTTRKIGFSAFILGVCLFYSQTAFSQVTKTWAGAAGADWSVAGNWSPSGVPAATDEVIINEGADVRVTASTTCRKLMINGSTAAGQGKVTIDAGTLTVTATDITLVPTGSTNAAVILYGGIIDNKSTLTINGRQSLDALRFDNPTSGSVNSTYMGSGTLTCNTSYGTTGGGGSGNTGAAVTFAQTSGTGATLTTSSSATYNFNIFITSATGGTKSVFYCQKGTATIDGNATIAITGGKRAIRVIPIANNDIPNLTIGSGVTMTLSTTLTGTTIGMILLDATALTSASASVTNKGTLTFSGDAGRPIYMTNSTTGNSTNFTNEGTININGTFADAGSEGGIAMYGSNTTQGNVFTNSSAMSAINFNTTGTSTKPLIYCSNSPKNTINNSGTITIGTGLTSLALAFRLGDSKTTVTNTGTVTVGAGGIAGTTTAGTGGVINANFNNNTGGILNLNSAVYVNNSNMLFTIGGGTLNLNASQRIGRLTVNGGAVAIADGTTFTVFGLILTLGNITLGTLGTGNIVIENLGGSVTGGSLASHIITNGTGTLSNQSVSTSGALFPIGQSASSYDPVVIKPATGPLTFGARVGLQTTALGTNPITPTLVVNREWDITGTQGTTDLTFVTSALNKNGGSTRPSVGTGTAILGHHNGTTWDDISADYATDTWTITGYTGTFSPFIVASPGAVLSAELTNFKATPLSKMNLLTWETASEVNNKGFDVQRQTSNGAWETLGFVQGIGKAATYTFEDKGPLSISYYRLRQIDFDGKETLSKIVSVRQDTKGRISISPNPTSDKVNILLNQNDVSNQPTTVILSDMTGRQVLTQTTTAGAFQLDLSNLAKGMYIVTLQSNNAIYQEKIIRQ